MLRATKIQIYATLMRQLGISPKRMFDHTGVDDACLLRPDHLISLEQYHAIVINMIKLARNPGLGFSIADIVKPADFGIVGYALMSSETLRQALRVWIEYSNSLVGTSIKVQTVEDLRSGYHLIFASQSIVEVIHRFETEELLACISLVPILTGVTPILEKVCFSYSKPSHSALYEQYFKCSIEFDAPKTAIIVRTPKLDVPVRTRNDELYEVCAQHCKKVMQSLPGSSILRSQLRNLFLAAPGNIPSLDFAAGKLGISDRKLRRQLELEGKSYQELKDEFRLDLTCEYLRSRHLATKAIASLLGFTTTSAFCRAFKVWTGQTVGQFLEAEADTPQRRSERIS